MTVPADERGLGADLRAGALDQMRAIAAALAGTTARHRGVHEARKAIRRLRAVLELAHARFGRRAQRLDARLKTLAGSLSALRDAHVVVDLAGRLARRATDEEERRRWSAARRRLVVRRQQLLASTLAQDPAFATRLAEVARLETALRRLPWNRLDPEDVRRALARSLRRVERARVSATATAATVEQRHRWRRRLRRLRMQWNALKTLRQREPESDPAVRRLLAWLRRKAPGFRTVSEAVDALGAEQDLGLLRAALEALPESQVRTEALAGLPGPGPGGARSVAPADAAQNT